MTNAGTVIHNSDSSRLTAKTFIGLDFHFSKEALRIMADEIRLSTSARPVNLNTDFYRNGMRNLLGESASKAISEEIGLFGTIRTLPSEFNFELLLNEVNFVWNDPTSSFRSTGKIGIGFIGEQPVNVYVDGYIEIQRRRTGARAIARYHRPARLVCTAICWAGQAAAGTERAEGGGPRDRRRTRARPRRTHDRGPGVDRRVRAGLHVVRTRPQGLDRHPGRSRRARGARGGHPARRPLAGRVPAPSRESPGAAAGLPAASCDSAGAARRRGHPLLRHLLRRRRLPARRALQLLASSDTKHQRECGLGAAAMRSVPAAGSIGHTVSSAASSAGVSARRPASPAASRKARSPVTSTATASACRSART